jgi:hypothetical protein
MKLRGFLALSLVAVVVTTGCSSAGAGPGPLLTASPSPSASGPDLSDATLWLAFEDESVDFDGATVYADALDGPFDGRVVTSGGGDVERTAGPDGRGLGVAFPARCGAPSACPRAIVEISSDPALDPGERDFEFGASVWLARDQTTRGSNIVQKGRFAASDGLWKLQVDSDEGEPSCVIRSGSDLVTVRSSVSIADGRWHRVRCLRDRQGVSIEVDGAVDRKAGSTGSVSSSWPVRIGGPGVGDHDDQFHGRVDDVYLRISR